MTNELDRALQDAAATFQHVIESQQAELREALDATDRRPQPTVVLIVPITIAPATQTEGANDAQ